MDKKSIEKIKNNPNYQKLVKDRNSLAWRLSFIMLIIYYSFILTIAFNPDILGTPIGDSVITVGIPIGIAVIFSAFLLTGIYTIKANREFDNLTQKIKDDMNL